MSEGLRKARIEIDLLMLTTIQQGMVALKTQADRVLASLNEQIARQLERKKPVERKRPKRAERVKTNGVAAH